MIKNGRIILLRLAFMEYLDKMIDNKKIHQDKTDENDGIN